MKNEHGRKIFIVVSEFEGFIFRRERRIVERVLKIEEGRKKNCGWLKQKNCMKDKREHILIVAARMIYCSISLTPGRSFSPTSLHITFNLMWKNFFPSSAAHFLGIRANSSRSDRCMKLWGGWVGKRMKYRSYMTRYRRWGESRKGRKRWVIEISVERVVDWVRGACLVFTSHISSSSENGSSEKVFAMMSRLWVWDEKFFSPLCGKAQFAN